MPFTVKTLNAFEATSRTAACEIPAKHAHHRAFVGIYPPKPERGIPEWRVRRFEIPAELLEKHFGEDDLVDSELRRLITLVEVEALLATWNVDAGSLDATWKCNYPL